MARFRRLLAFAHVAMEQVKRLDKLAAGLALAVRPHRVAVVRHLVEPDVASAPAFDKVEDGGFRPLTALANEYALREADDGLEVAFVEQPPGAVRRRCIDPR